METNIYITGLDLSRLCHNVQDVGEEETARIDFLGYDISFTRSRLDTDDQQCSGKRVIFYALPGPFGEAQNAPEAKAKEQRKIFLTDSV